MASEAMLGAAHHFDDRIFALKPHPGQRACARWISSDLEYAANAPRDGARVQDRYSLRCAPHVVGVLLDALPLARQLIETELNGVNDNPIVDVETGRIHSGGNFYAGHVGFSMDALKTLVANVADLLDRQLALLLNPVTSAGLPADLVGAEGAARAVNFGFKAMGISASALTAEALKLTMPASVFSRSTENHNQDKVSMGTIAARDCLRILELSETVAMIHLLALCQAADLRKLECSHARSRALHAAVRRSIPRVDQDRAMDGDIAGVLALYRRGELPIGEIDFA
jgi:histidine ammonia-lyase